MSQVMPQTIAFVLVGSLILGCCYPAAAMNCLDQNGQAVDWWIMYKLSQGADPPPGWKGGDVGMQYAYIDHSTTGTKPPLAEGMTIDNADTALGRTLTQIYSTAEASDTGYVFYNDEPPHQTPSSVRGHTKGVVGFDSQGGFWLIHSTPKFPEGPSRTSSYDFPSTEEIYGQTFFCLSFSLSSINDVGTQLQYNRPQVYDYNIPSSLSSQVSQLADAASGKYINAPSSNVITMKTSLQGVSLVSFAKTSKWAKDLYSSLVAPYFDQPLIVETWMRPYRPDCCPPDDNCPDYSVVNVKTLDVGGFTFKETQDHSKWAITSTGSVVCIGDINRNLSQRKRGGGTMCFHNPDIYAMFHGAITSTAPCGSTTASHVAAALSRA